MKKLFLFFFLAPAIAFAQNGFTINGRVSGYENGTSVSFLNDMTGAPEKQTTIENGTFSITGKLNEPEFKVLLFGDAPPAIPVFLENSKITINGTKEKPDQMEVSGSKSHEEYVYYMNKMQPYLSVFQNQGAVEPAQIQEIQDIAEDFIRKNPGSFVAPIALIQLVQIQKVQKAEELLSLLSDDVKKSQLAQYISSQLSVLKINSLGSVIPDFSQEDTSGKVVGISSFRGKYVLIDFWASWCMPCRQENPNVVANFNKYKGKNFTVLGVSLDQSKSAWLKAIKKDHLNWTQLSDLKGWRNAVAAQFHITSIPQNFLIDPDGKIIAKNLRGDELGKKLKELLGE